MTATTTATAPSTTVALSTPVCAIDMIYSSLIERVLLAFDWYSGEIYKAEGKLSGFCRVAMLVVEWTDLLLDLCGK